MDMQQVGSKALVQERGHVRMHALQQLPSSPQSHAHLWVDAKFATQAAGTGQQGQGG